MPRPKNEENDTCTSFRLSSELLDRADIIAAQLQELGYPKMNRSDVLRLALTEGIEHFEKEVRAAKPLDTVPAH